MNGEGVTQFSSLEHIVWFITVLVEDILTSHSETLSHCIGHQNVVVMQVLGLSLDRFRV